MLLSVTVETNSKYKNDVGTRLIRAELLSDGVTVESTKTRFSYPLNYRDSRELPTTLKTTDAIATLRASMNGAYATESITLPVHPEGDVALTVVNTEFWAKNIIWGIPLPSDPTNKTLVWITNGAFKVKKYVVDLTIAEIVALV